LQKWREIIVSRVKEGIEKAKRYGTKSGVPIVRLVATLPKDFDKYYKKWKTKKISGVEFSNLLRIGRTTLYRYIKVYEG